MVDSSTPLNVKSRAATYLYFGSLYFVSVGILYLWGYWSRFDINILQYLSLPDVLKLTALPIVSSLAAMLVGATVAEIFVGAKLPSGGGRNSKIGIILRKLGPALAILYAIGTIALLIYGPERKWLVLPVLLSTPVYFYAKEVEFLEGEIQNEGPRSVVIFMLSVLPLMSYGLGRIDAGAVLNGERYFYLKSGATCGNSECLRLLGNAGNIYFYFDPKTQDIVLDRVEAPIKTVIHHFNQEREPGAKEP